MPIGVVEWEKILLYEPEKRKKITQTVSANTVRNTSKNEKFLEKIAADPRHDEDLATIINRDLNNIDVYAVDRVVHWNSTTSLVDGGKNVSERSRDWISLMNLGENRADVTPMTA